MKYALLGDIHSSIDNLKNVLGHIQQEAPEATLIGTGDVYECTISKKDITDKKFTELSKVMLNPEGFTRLLTFPSIRGNQEERILQITETDEDLRKDIQMMPEKIELVNAEVIHGHQWVWGGSPWSLMKAQTHQPITFYGHSHTSALMIDDEKKAIEFDKVYELKDQHILVNVGSVTENEEWVLYDAKKSMITFKRTKEN